MHSVLLETPSKVIFGPFPSQEVVTEMSQSGVRLFLDLTQVNEDGTHPYQVPDGVGYIKYSIRDNYAPSNWESYAKLILTLVSEIQKGTCMYIHCRAGHGRSSTICTSILCQLDTELHPERAIKRVAQIHSQRVGLSARWDRVRNPLSRAQHIFIYKFFSTLFFTRANDEGFYHGFSSCSPHSIRVNDLVFPNAESAFQYYKDPSDEAYVNKLLDPHKGSSVKFIGDDHWNPLLCDEEMNEFEIMYKIIKQKYEDYPELAEVLRQTNLKRIYDGCFNSHPDNLVGRVLMKLRDELIEKDI